MNSPATQSSTTPGDVWDYFYLSILYITQRWLNAGTIKEGETSVLEPRFEVEMRDWKPPYGAGPGPRIWPSCFLSGPANSVLGQESPLSFQIANWYGKSGKTVWSQATPFSFNLIIEPRDDLASSVTSRETKRCVLLCSESPYCIVRGCGQNVAAHDYIQVLGRPPPAKNDPHARWIRRADPCACSATNKPNPWATRASRTACKSIQIQVQGISIRDMQSPDRLLGSHSSVVSCNSWFDCWAINEKRNISHKWIQFGVIHMTLAHDSHCRHETSILLNIGGRDLTPGLVLDENVNPKIYSLPHDLGADISSIIQSSGVFQENVLVESSTD